MKPTIRITLAAMLFVATPTFATDTAVARKPNPAAQAYLECLNSAIAAQMYIDEARRGKLRNAESILNKCKDLRKAALRAEEGRSLERIFSRIENDMRSRDIGEEQ